MPLDYATPAARTPSGPLLFKPSRLALLLTILTIATAAWLARRHHPWTRTATVNEPHRQGLTLVVQSIPGAAVASSERAVRVFDAATGRLLAEFGSQPDSAAFATPDARRVLERRGDTYTLYDARSAERLRSATLPPGQTFSAIDNSGFRIATSEADVVDALVRREDQELKPRVNVWDLDRPLPPWSDGVAEPVFAFAGFEAAISPDGRLLALSSSDASEGKWGNRAKTTVVAVDTGRPALEVEGSFEAQFSLDSRRLSLHRLRMVRHSEVQIFDARTGKPLGVRMSTLYQGQTALSPDESRAAWLGRRRPPLTLVFMPLAPDGRFAGNPTSRPVDASSSFSSIGFFADNSPRLIGPGPDLNSLAVYETPNLRPLAVFRNLRATVYRTTTSVDARDLALLDGAGTLQCFQPTGPDCPESPLGALAFPHLWLLVLFTTALALTLRRDARRSAAELPTSIRLLSLALLLAALPRTLHCLLAACLGEPRVLTPAPLLLLAGVALATGHNLHRLLTLTLLAATLPLELYCLHRLHQLGLGDSTPTLLFDRTYAIPHRPVFIALALATATIPAAIAILARRRA